MTDPDLIARKLAAIETFVADLRRLAGPGGWLPSDLAETLDDLLRFTDVIRSRPS